MGGGHREGRGYVTAAAAARRTPIPVSKHQVSASGGDFVPSRVDSKGDEFFFALVCVRERIRRNGGRKRVREGSKWVDG
jgi:hypothetical protein